MFCVCLCLGLRFIIGQLLHPVPYYLCVLMVNCVRARQFHLHSQGLVLQLQEKMHTIESNRGLMAKPWESPSIAYLKKISEINTEFKIQHSQ